MEINLDNILGVVKPSYHKCIISVTTDNRCFLIKSENNLEEVLDDSDLSYNIDNPDLLPIEPGIYRCVLKYHSFKCNSYDDPEEWDNTLTIESFEQIDINL